jgi:hypothetical protein
MDKVLNDDDVQRLALVRNSCGEGSICFRVMRHAVETAGSKDGKTYKAFLEILCDTLELPEILRTGDGEDALSPQRPYATKKRISYNMWAVEEEWVTFRTTLHSGRVPSHLTTLVQQEFLPTSASNVDQFASGQRE